MRSAEEWVLPAAEPDEQTEADRHTWWARLTDTYRVYDGDSIKDATIDIGWHHGQFDCDIRLICSAGSIDAPELRGRDRQAGLIVRDFVSDWIRTRMEHGTVWLQSFAWMPEGKYGRMLAAVHSSVEELGVELLGRGFAMKSGVNGKRHHWTETQLQRIVDAAKSWRDS